MPDVLLLLSCLCLVCNSRYPARSGLGNSCMGHDLLLNHRTGEVVEDKPKDAKVPILLFDYLHTRHFHEQDLGCEEVQATNVIAAGP